MATLVEKVGSVAVLEPGERIICAAYVPAIAATRQVKSARLMGAAVVAVSDRRFLFAPRSAFMSASSWQDRRLEDVRVDVSSRRSLSFPIGRARVFEVAGADGPLVFELEQKKDATAFRDALGRRLVRRG